MLLSILIAAVIAGLAGLVRGFSGFGYAVMMVLGLNLLMPAQPAIATAILLDLTCSLGLLAEARSGCERRLLGRLVLGMVLSLPVGLWIMTVLPAHWMSQLVGAVSLVGGVLIWCRVPLPQLHNRLAVPAGMASGLAMTTASAGGPPLMVYLMNQPLPAQTQRATAIWFFALCSSGSLLGMALCGLLSLDNLRWAAVLWLPSVLGNQLGLRLFRRHGQLAFHLWVAPLLILLALWVMWH